MKKLCKKDFLIPFILLLAQSGFSQNVGINTTGAVPNSSALMDLNTGNTWNSPNGKGMLIPCMTTAQMTAIVAPAKGLMIFNTDCLNFYFYNGTIWIPMGGSSLAAPAPGKSIVSATQITWKWTAVAGATAYFYNTVNNLAGATNNGLSTTYIQSGLQCGVTYNLFVWAYNGTCYSSSNELTETAAADGTGGTITHVNGQTIHTFTSSGVFTPSACIDTVQYLIVGGGGGGGGTGVNGGGGGGGGGVITGKVYVTAIPYAMTVGPGGPNGATGSNGGNSVFHGFTAFGGGGGGSYQSSGNNGGSGGGSGRDCNACANAIGVAGQGSNGGTSPYNSWSAAGGGGGAGMVGYDGDYDWTTISGTFSQGGDGVSSSISGTLTYYGGGGGGAWQSDVIQATGGLGGGGLGAANTGGVSATNGTSNTGGGGGGGQTQGWGTPGGDGGSGIVIITYPTP